MFDSIDRSQFPMKRKHASITSNDCLDSGKKIKADRSSSSSPSSSLSSSLIDNNHNLIDNRDEFICDYCSNCFSNSAELKQHIDTCHSKTSFWRCSECNKVFTSKSNLKVHLRVHTRIKPYHCKSCQYSCMHHSSIKEHINKIHPGVVHSASNPAYVFNSVAVPDPVHFNSSTFDRNAFIAEAREANDKLAAQINGSSTPVPSTSSSKRRSSISPVSDHSSPNTSILNDENTVPRHPTQLADSKKTDFSISSIISTPSTTSNKPLECERNQYQYHQYSSTPNSAATQPTISPAALLAYTAQMQLFYSYLSRFGQGQRSSF